ncbi:(2Fe-2S) ferredoxin domain-containing protein [Methylocystis echinoides]|uniref:(2Fe-2S) ferredoxin n=1 Tax=Methylocystis echinoides TaxID=29468 RepID=A0A9W6GTP5_9HYPH|nr:(2Fe-2S) ferredoxin domain-containing protein [Methylocystis echinoides]GLI92671.1 (2Fe-2S) ferredoxin [Methylocystis echinoides]
MIEPFRHHLFVCTNKRDGRAACEDHGAKDALAKAKEAVNALPAAEREGVRVSAAGCLGRCAHGPVAVLYPAGAWISYESAEDLTRFVMDAIRR